MFEHNPHSTEQYRMTLIILYDLLMYGEYHHEAAISYEMCIGDDIKNINDCDQFGLSLTSKFIALCTNENKIDWKMCTTKFSR